MPLQSYIRGTQRYVPMIFMTGSSPARCPAGAACQLPDQSTIIRVRPSLTDSSRPWGARSIIPSISLPFYFGRPVVVSSTPTAAQVLGALTQDDGYIVFDKLGRWRVTRVRWPYGMKRELCLHASGQIMRSKREKALTRPPVDVSDHRRALHSAFLQTVSVSSSTAPRLPAWLDFSQHIRSHRDLRPSHPGIPYASRASVLPERQDPLSLLQHHSSANCERSAGID